MSNLTDFFPSGGGGGLTPKFEEFNASGTFTPTQALIDAGGYIEVFLVAGGGGGMTNVTNGRGANGGEVQIKKMYLSSVSSCSVTIGAGGSKSTSPSDGGNSSFTGSSAGGTDLTCLGGYKGGSNSSSVASQEGTSKSPNWGAFKDGEVNASAGNGVFGYGAGGAYYALPTGAWSLNGESPSPNSGQGGVSSNNPSTSSSGAPGYSLIKWYE